MTDSHLNIEQNNTGSGSSDTAKMDNWFDKLIGSIRADQLQLQTNTADNEKTSIYNTLMSDNPLEVVADMRMQSSKFMVKWIMDLYIKELRKRKVDFSKLAFDLGDAKILVWAEIEDDDEASEDGLIMAEATANAQIATFGFHISSTIVESSDKLSVPSHYSTLKFKK